MFKHETQVYKQPETQKKDTVIKESHKKKDGKCPIHKEHKRHCVDCEA